MKNLQLWQAKTLAILGLMLFGMMVRDAVEYLFASLWNLTTTDWTAAASLTIILFIFALIMSMIMNSIKKGPQQGNRPNFNHNQGR